MWRTLMSVARLEVSARSNANRPDTARIVHALRSAAPALLFGLRLWTAVWLALYTAFWLQLDNTYWAGTSAAIVCQPSLGASLRKGWFRMVGTAVGAVAIVVLTVCFPQGRIGFLLGLAHWGAACGLVATLLRNFAAYAAALAGYARRAAAADRSYSSRWWGTGRTPLCTRFPSRFGECTARLPHDRRPRALLDRYRMAERRSGHHVRGDLRHPVL